MNFQLLAAMGCLDNTTFHRVIDDFMIKVVISQMVMEQVDMPHLGKVSATDRQLTSPIAQLMVGRFLTNPTT